MAAARRSIAMMRLLDARLDSLDLARPRDVQRQDSLAAQELAYELLLGA